MSFSKRRRLLQAALSALLMTVGIGLYLGVQAVVEPRYVLGSALDDAIPFNQWAIIPYMAYYPYVVLLTYFANTTQFRNALHMLAYCCGISMTIFLLMPASVARVPAQMVSNPILRDVYATLQRVDASHNSFPSMHVCIVWAATFALTDRRWAPWTAPAAMMISLSTLFTKQHTIADFVGGFVLAFAGWWWVAGRKSVRATALA